VLESSSNPIGTLKWPIFSAPPPSLRLMKTSAAEVPFSAKSYSMMPDQSSSIVPCTPIRARRFKKPSSSSISSSSYTA
jgi:hypothetical protein